MPRESAAAKADRLLVEGRVIIRHVDKRNVVAAVRGEGHVYGTWSCSCPVRTDQCSHLIALRRVVAVDLPRGRI